MTREPSPISEDKGTANYHSAPLRGPATSSRQSDLRVHWVNHLVFLGSLQPGEVAAVLASEWVPGQPLWIYL